MTIAHIRRMTPEQVAEMRLVTGASDAAILAHYGAVLISEPGAPAPDGYYYFLVAHPADAEGLPGSFFAHSYADLSANHATEAAYITAAQWQVEGEVDAEGNPIVHQGKAYAVPAEAVNVVTNPRPALFAGME